MSNYFEFPACCIMACVLVLVVGLTIESCAAPAVNLFTIVMAASLIPPDTAEEQAAPQQRPQQAALDQRASLDLEKEIADEGHWEGDIAKPAETQPVQLADPPALPKTVVDIKLALVFSLLRLLVIPALALSAQFAISRVDFMPFDKLGLLVCYLQTVVPSAQMGIVVLQQLGCSTMASRLAQLVAIQYVLAAFSLTGFTALVMYLVEQHFQ